MLCAAGASVHTTRAADGGDLWSCAIARNPSVSGG